MFSLITKPRVNFSKVGSCEQCNPLNLRKILDKFGYKRAELDMRGRFRKVGAWRKALCPIFEKVFTGEIVRPRCRAQIKANLAI